MALTRTIVQNDSGSGNDGTIATNEWLQGVWNTIDSRWSEKTTQLTGTQNNLSLVDGNIEADRLICQNASDLTITGIAKPASPLKPGKLLSIHAAGAGNVYIPFDSGSSTAGNRFYNGVTSGNTPLAAGWGRALYMYSEVSAGWVLLFHEQGAWITPTFAAGNYTSSGTWTVASGDVNTQAYYLSGRNLTVTFSLSTTSVSGTPTTLLIGSGAWGGFTATKSVIVMGMASNAGGANETTYIGPGAGATTIGITQLDGNPWSDATNTTAVHGQIVIEVT